MTISFFLTLLVLSALFGMALARPTYRIEQQDDGRQFEVMVLDKLKTSGAVTADSQSDSVDLGNRRTLDLFLDVTAASGTDETLDVTVQHSHDNATWVTLGTFTQATGVTSQRKTFGPCMRYVRYDYNIGGTDTPSFTFAITGTAQ